VALNPALKAEPKRFPKPLLWIPLASSCSLFLRSRAHNAGLKVNALTAEIRMAMASVKAN